VADRHLDSAAMVGFNMMLVTALLGSAAAAFSVPSVPSVGSKVSARPRCAAQMITDAEYRQSMEQKAVEVQAEAAALAEREKEVAKKAAAISMAAKLSPDGIAPQALVDAAAPAPAVEEAPAKTAKPANLSPAQLFERFVAPIYVPPAVAKRRPNLLEEIKAQDAETKQAAAANAEAAREASAARAAKAQEAAVVAREAAAAKADKVKAAAAAAAAAKAETAAAAKAAKEAAAQAAAEKRAAAAAAKVANAAAKRPAVAPKKAPVVAKKAPVVAKKGAAAKAPRGASSADPAETSAETPAQLFERVAAPIFVPPSRPDLKQKYSKVTPSIPAAKVAAKAPKSTPFSFGFNQAKVAPTKAVPRAASKSAAKGAKAAKGATATKQTSWPWERE